MKTSAAFLSSDLNANPHPLEIVRGQLEKEIGEEVRRRIEERAYCLYGEEGCRPGRHVQHWLQAEREILQRVTQVRESGSWVIVNLHVPNVPAEGFKLIVDEEQALVEVEEPTASHRPPREQKCSFYVARWPGSVDPNTASAYVKNGMLTLEVKLKPCPSEVLKKTAASAQAK